MAVFGGLLDIVVVVFLVLVFAKYAAVPLSKKALSVIAVAGALLLLGAGSSLLAATGVAAVVTGAEALFSVIGWIVLLIGVILAIIDLVR